MHAAALHESPESDEAIKLELDDDEALSLIIWTLLPVQLGALVTNIGSLTES